MRMFELRFLIKHGEASFRIAWPEAVGEGKPKTSEGGLAFLWIPSLQSTERKLL
jgi:hypothetical protein